jgi:hypothetical protein
MAAPIWYGAVGNASNMPASLNEGLSLTDTPAIGQIVVQGNRPTRVYGKAGGSHKLIVRSYGDAPSKGDGWTEAGAQETES